ncbi:hypothetical protein GCM10027048_15180 [Hymenobacter coalescens]
MAKLDAGGNWLWARRAGGTSDDYVTGLALAGNTVYACGSFASVLADFGSLTLTNIYTVRDGRSDIFLAQLDVTSGTWTGAYRAGGVSTDYATALATDAQSNVYVTGAYGGTNAAFGSTVLTGSSNSSKAFVAKLEPGRGWRWAVAPVHSGGAVGQAIAVDDQAKVTVAGGFYGWLHFNATILRSSGSVVVNGVPRPLDDAFVARLDSAGTWQWAVQPIGQGNEGSMSVAVDGWGNTTVAVSFDRGIAFGPAQLPSSSSSSSIALARLSPAGSWSWIMPSGGSSAQVLDNGAGQLYLAGTFGLTAAGFGPFTLPANPAPAPSAYWGTGFLARLSAGPLAAAGPKQATDWTVYPNPARAYVGINGLPPRAAVEVLDALGRRVAGGSTPAQGSLRLQLPPALPIGLYTVRSGGQARRLRVE